jgi:hypothetical protein
MSSQSGRIGVGVVTVREDTKNGGVVNPSNPKYYNLF